MRIAILFWLIITIVNFGNGKTYFTQDPSLSPDGNKIIFSYECDIWKVNSNGGKALRLTGMESVESDPLYSPDGKWIAFTGREQGNANIYLLPVNGGDIRQLTFHSSDDKVSSWSWDSKYVYFSSSRKNGMVTTYKVSVDGGTPKLLFEHYFDWVHNLVEDPNSNEIYFSTSWESFRFPNRKRYKGDFNPNIQSYNLETSEYKVLTEYRGKDFFPTIDKKGNLYFVSDEANSEYNLYTFDNGQKTQVTNFSTSIKKPKVSADGSKVVFEKDYQIYVYDTKSKETSKVKIEVFKNEELETAQEFNVSNEIEAFDVSPDGKKVAFSSRGKLFVSDIKAKFVKEIQTAHQERVIEVKWLKDNETILFNQTQKGWLNLYTANAGNNEPPVQLTDESQNNRSLELNNDRTKALYLSGRNELRLLDLESMESETIVEDEFWALSDIPARFSPDGKYILYTAYRNFEQDIFVYNLNEEESRHITQTGVTETEPYWSPDGKYIYFTSDRTNPAYPQGTQNTNIYRIALQNYGEKFKSDNYKEMFTEKTDSTETSNTSNVQINFTELRKRWQSIASEKSNQYTPFVFQKDNETTVIYSSAHTGKRELWKKTIKPFESNKMEKIGDIKGSDYRIVQNDKKLFLINSGSIYELNPEKPSLEKIEIEYDFTKNLRNEFIQMFYETWANMQENYYSKDFHGADWDAVKDYYAQFLSYLNSRDNLRQLLNDMLGELNSSHQGFGSSGEEEKTFYDLKSAYAGIKFSSINPYKVQNIIEQSPAHKMNIDLKKGDILTQVNGKPVDTAQNRESYFLFPSIPEELNLTFSRDGEEFEVNVHPSSFRSMNRHLYDEWIERNQEIVDSASNEKIAYIHMKKMGSGSLEDFQIEVTNELHYRNALILDLRYNRGGNVHDDVLQLLSQKPYLQWKYREGKLTKQPNFYPSAKPIILLINQQTLSDAEMTDRKSVV